jgi:ABC-type nitrate/sulfonate/bicarbonate transport system permease component
MSTETVVSPTTTKTPRPSTGRRRRRGSGTPARGLLPLVVALGIWQIVGDPESAYFPPPSEWWKAVRPLFADGTMWQALGWTALTFFLGLLLAAIFGGVLGTVVGSSRRADRAFGPLLEFMRAMPAAAIVPVLALILGYTTTMKLTVVVIPTTWPILLACRSARRSMSPLLMEVPRTLGMSRVAALRKVLIPAMTPALLLGIRVAGPLALIVTLLVEIVTRINGLGSLLANAQTRYLSAQVWGLLIIAGVLGFAVNWAVTRGEGAVARRMGVSND